MVDFKEFFNVGVAGSVKHLHFKVAPKDYFDFLNYLIKYGCDCWSSGEKFVTEPHEINTKPTWYMVGLWYSDKLNKYVLGQVPAFNRKVAHRDAIEYVKKGE